MITRLVRFALVLAVLAGPAAHGVAQERKAALIVGIGHYVSDRIPDLTNPINDARSMFALLSDLGVEAEIMEDGDRASIVAAVSALGQRVGPEGAGILYFAGHGVQSGGHNYLLPADFVMTGASELDARALNVSAAIGALRAAGAGTVMVILDACRNNPFGEQGVFGTGLALVDAPGDALIAYATSPGAIAEDGYGANSPYTAALVSALALPAQSVMDALKLVRVKVRQATNGRQIPYVMGSLARPLILGQGGERSLASDGPLPEGMDVGSVWWRTIRSSADPADFMRFLDDRRESPFAPLAARRLDELRGEGRTPLPALELRAARAAVPSGLDSRITDCDVLASDPYDRRRLTDGVPRELINTRFAIRACSRAVAAAPDDPRQLFNLAWALDAADRFDEARHYYEEAGQRGYSQALKHLGYMYRTARGVPQSDERALELYLAAALLGNDEARTSVGTMYLNGWGTEPSAVEAVRWYSLAASTGSPGAHDALGNMFRRGRGVPEDLDQAAENFNIAAILGSTNAMHNLGRLYRDSKDYTQAVRWLSQATQLGNPYSPYELGRMFLKGWGVEQDHQLARAYFELAADRGFAESYLALGEMYEQGQGGPVDLTRAAFNYVIAREGGRAKNDSNALKAADAAAARLAAIAAADGAALTAGERQAADWLGRNGLLQFKEIVLY